jgi:hypothetical protein
MHPINVLPKKLNFLGLLQIFSWQNSCLAKTFFCVHFLLRSNILYNFEIRFKRRIFDAPLAIFEEKMDEI